MGHTTRGRNKSVFTKEKFEIGVYFHVLFYLEKKMYL